MNFSLGFYLIFCAFRFPILSFSFSADYIFEEIARK